MFRAQREVGQRHRLAGEALSLAAVDRPEMAELAIDDRNRAAFALPRPAAARQRDTGRAGGIEQRPPAPVPRRSFARCWQAGWCAARDRFGTVGGETKLSAKMSKRGTPSAVMASISVVTKSGEPQT